MDFSESLKIPINKSHVSQSGNIVNGAPVGVHVSTSEQGAGYVTEKLYMLLQLYLQNKGWNPSVELLQCFAELKDTPILPSASYLQALASRVALDNQGRLVLRETGKIVLPYEHFANAVMLKHMSGPHGLHLSIEATVRAVMDSYTIGRESFGMEKEFIVEVVQSCPSPACRYYKGQIGVGPFIDQSTFGNPGAHLNSEYLTHLQQQLGQHQNANAIDISANENTPKGLMPQVKISKPTVSPQHQSHISAALFQQQQQLSRAVIPQKTSQFDGFSTLSTFDKQRMLQHLQDKQKHFDVGLVAPPQHSQQSLVVGSAGGSGTLGSAVVGKQQHVSTAASLLQQHQTQALALSQAAGHQAGPVPPSPVQHHLHHTQQQQSVQSLPPPPPPPPQQQAQQLPHPAALHVQPQTIVGPLVPLMNQPPVAPGLGVVSPAQQQQQQQQLAMQAHLSQPPMQTVNMDTGHKLSDYMRGAVDPHENVSSSSSELLALHNGSWNQERDGIVVSQEKIIRAFSELMRNISKMKTFVRPSMCKPYGKQSESLQKTLFDTIQLLQMLRNCLPAPHIPVSSWKSDPIISGSNSEAAMN